MHAVAARSTFRSQNVQSTPFSEHFWTLKRRFVWQAHRTFEEDLQRCISRGRRNTRDMFIRELGGQRADFLRRVAFWSIRFSGLLIKMILRDRCSTSYDLASHGLDGMGKRQNALARGNQLCTQLSIFEGSLAELFRF